jgi:ArsR family transcriptional regulator
MTIDMELASKTTPAAGEPCCEPVVYPDVERDHALRMAEVAKALGVLLRHPDAPTELSTWLS